MKMELKKSPEKNDPVYIKKIQLKIKLIFTGSSTFILTVPHF
jgi:hypothetical protein